ncbi:MAG: dihydropyrimidinase [Bacteroidetes bacterium GWC2_33_15]|nr:MAG: dihydropyrimidinase [Bacteroidetes bacterium GWA2_33_15]OFX48606.1 MAG: dihydropyrimidinase [Bacteroidetes bacterium GWC2_33_15]OFX64580.1 MAG: dihydropyrimidinase [Bacteroidetes bacterium GWB2_32_14]OFX68002.1 MAG: dihydropyrimidinase [Bacteroidetes bacterium GWD2_33_33]HAN18237.1 dihydropyrimidinase [Bacteroidales bacterium]
MNIIIKNGTIVTSGEILESDILIENGIISKIEKSLNTLDKLDKTIDAKGLIISPGGIDPHVHMYLPTPAGYSSDNFNTGSIAALFGGTTTLLDFVTPRKGQSLTDALDQRISEAGNSLCDYSFHVSPIEWTENTENEINDCIKAGITSFKVYMAYKGSVGLDDTNLQKVLKVVGKAGGLVTVHCEMGDEIEVLRNQFVSEGKIESRYHALSRPAELEAEAVQKVVDYAKETNCTVYIVHVSSEKSLKIIEKAQKSGQKVFAETCPHYLLLDDSKYNGTFKDTVKYVLSPPLRKKADQEALWDNIQKGVISTIGTDHCPFNLIQKSAGINDFRKVPNGAGGVEHRLTLLYTYGILENKITWNQFVDITSTQTAKIFGLYPQKGEIAVGSDADLVIWNPEKKNTISARNHHQNCDLEIYEGFKTKGAPEFVLKKGEIVIDKGELISNRTGLFLKRKIK